jgi:hypothetical protein
LVDKLGILGVKYASVADSCWVGSDAMGGRGPPTWGK